MISSPDRGGRPRGRPAGRVPLSEDPDRREVVLLDAILRVACHLQKHTIARAVFALLDPQSGIYPPAAPGAPIVIMSRRSKSNVKSRQKYIVTKRDAARVGPASRCDANSIWLSQSVAIVTAFLNGGTDDGVLSSADWRALVPELTMIRDVLRWSGRKNLHVRIYLELRSCPNRSSLRRNDERSMRMRMAFQIDEVSWMASLPRATVDEAVRTGALVVREAGGHQVVLTTDLQNFMDGLPPVRTANATKERT